MDTNREKGPDVHSIYLRLDAPRTELRLFQTCNGQRPLQPTPCNSSRREDSVLERKERESRTVGLGAGKECHTLAIWGLNSHTPAIDEAWAAR